MEEGWQEENFTVFNLKESEIYFIFSNLHFTLIKKYFYIHK